MTPQKAFTQSLNSLSNPSVWPHFIWPFVFAALLWVGVAIWGLTAFDIKTWLASSDLSVSSSAAAWLDGFGRLGLGLIALVLFGPLVHLTAVVLVGVIAVPLIVSRVAASDYAGLEQRHGGSVLGSVVNALVTSLGFLLLFVGLLPLYLLGPLGLLGSLFATAWLNKKIYLYDALMEHASRDEREAIARTNRGGLWKIALIGGVASLVPVVNFFAPALIALQFVHFCLGNLEALRAQSNLR